MICDELLLGLLWLLYDDEEEEEEDSRCFCLSILLLLLLWVISFASRHILRKSSALITPCPFLSNL